MEKICVIIPTKNVMPYLERLFRSINNIDYPQDDLVFVFADGESTDGTFEYLKNKKIKFKKIVITKKNSTRPNARNAAYKYITDNKIKHDFISTIDADVLVYPEFFKRMIKHFYDKKVGMVASYFMYDKNRFLEDYTNSYLGNKIGKVVNTGSCPTGCAIFRKGCFDSFDEEFVCHEDGDLALSVTEKGWKGLQDFTKTCAHIKKQTVKKELKELYGMGYYEPLLWLKHPSYITNKRVLAGSIFYISMILSIPLFVLGITRVIPTGLSYILPVAIIASFLLHLYQIKTRNPVKRLVYSAFTTFRFLIYFTATLHRIIKLPFQKHSFRQLNIQKYPNP